MTLIYENDLPLVSKGLQRLVKVSSLDIIHDLDIACWGLTRGPGLVSTVECRALEI